MKLNDVDWEKWRRGKAPFENILGNYQLNILRDFCNGNSLLDIGCGDGIITYGLKDKFECIYGTDEHHNSIEQAKQLVPNGKFFTSTIENFIPDRKFDTIIMISVLEHLSDPITTLSRISNWLSDNGILQIHVPNANSLNRVLGTKMNLLKKTTDLSPHDNEVGHTNMFDMTKLKKIVTMSNLKVINSGGFFLKAHTNQQMQILYESNLWENNELKQKYFDALFEIGKEIPEYASTIYINCEHD